METIWLNVNRLSEGDSVRLLNCCCTLSASWIPSHTHSPVCQMKTSITPQGCEEMNSLFSAEGVMQLTTPVCFFMWWSMTDRVTWTDIMLTPGAHVSRFCHAAPPAVSLSRAESVSVLILWSYTKNRCDWQTKWMFSPHCCPLVVTGCSVHYRASQYSVTSDEGSSM